MKTYFICQGHKVYVGDIVNFVYNGGSHPGRVRSITVDSISSTHLCGWDGDGFYKSFLVEKISDFGCAVKVTQTSLPMLQGVVVLDKNNNLSIEIGNASLTISNNGHFNLKGLSVTVPLLRELGTYFRKQV